jgi:hypothetical protein
VSRTNKSVRVETPLQIVTIPRLAQEEKKRLSQSNSNFIWWCAGFMACVAGVLVWSARSSADKALRDTQDAAAQPPVDDLAAELQDAWSAYHNR